MRCSLYHPSCPLRWSAGHPVLLPTATSLPTGWAQARPRWRGAAPAARRPGGVVWCGAGTVLCEPTELQECRRLCTGTRLHSSSKRASAATAAASRMLCRAPPPLLLPSRERRCIMPLEGAGAGKGAGGGEDEVGRAGTGLGAGAGGGGGAVSLRGCAAPASYTTPESGPSVGPFEPSRVQLVAPCVTRAGVHGQGLKIEVGGPAAHAAAEHPLGADAAVYQYTCSCAARPLAAPRCPPPNLEVAKSLVEGVGPACRQLLAGQAAVAG